MFNRIFSSHVQYESCFLQTVALLTPGQGHISSYRLLQPCLVLWCCQWPFVLLFSGKLDICPVFFTKPASYMKWQGVNFIPEPRQFTPRLTSVDKLTSSICDLVRYHLNSRESCDILTLSWICLFFSRSVLVSVPWLIALNEFALLMAHQKESTGCQLEGLVDGPLNSNASANWVH